MEAIARDETYCIDTDCEIVELTPGSINCDAQSQVSFDEIDAWARRALAANGFSDY
jgi:hypothetical protein